MDVEDAADEESDGGGESCVGLHDLRRLLLDDEGAGDEVAEELGELGEELGDDGGGHVRVVLAHAAVDVLQLLHLLPHRPDDVGQALAPERAIINLSGVYYQYGLVFKENQN